MSLQNIILHQYELVKDSREIVFKFCEKFEAGDHTKEVEGFGRGSICTTQIHIANTYTFWVANSIMNKSLPYIKYEPMKIDDLRKDFDTVNLFIADFLKHYKDILHQNIEINIPENQGKIKVSLLQVFTHVITHEFHHKGQIMIMGRLLGYTPPDADIIRFS